MNANGLRVTQCPPWLRGKKNHGGTESTEDHGGFSVQELRQSSSFRGQLRKIKFKLQLYFIIY